MASSTQFSVTLTRIPDVSADGPHSYEATAVNPTGKTTVWDIVKKVFETQAPFTSYDITTDVTGVRVELLCDESQNIVVADWRGRICHLTETTLPTDGNRLLIPDSVHPIQFKAWDITFGKKTFQHVAILCRYIFSIKDREKLLITSRLFTNTRLYRYLTNRERTILSLQIQTQFLRFLQNCPSPGRRRITAADLSVKSTPTFDDSGTEEAAYKTLADRVVHWSSFPRHATPIRFPKKITRADGTIYPLEEYAAMAGTPVTCAEIAADDARLAACRAAAKAAVGKTFDEQQKLFSTFFELPAHEKAKLLFGEIRWTHEYLDAFQSTTVMHDSKGQGILFGEFENCMNRLSFHLEKNLVEKYAQQVQEAEKTGWTCALVVKANEELKSVPVGVCQPQPTNQLLLELEAAFKETSFRRKALQDCYFEVQYLTRCYNNLNTSLLTLKTLSAFVGPDLLAKDRRKLKSKLGNLMGSLRIEYAQLPGRISQMWAVMTQHFIPTELIGLIQLYESGFPPETIDPHPIPLDDWMFNGKQITPKDCSIM